MGWIAVRSRSARRPLRRRPLRRRPLRHWVLAGAVAGAVGTIALDVVTYLDMVVRARPPSRTPSAVAEALAERTGVELGDGEPAANRRSGLGALLGYLTGLGIGLVYGALRSRIRPPWLAAGAALGVTAMAASDAPATALGVTDPREWPASSWAADLVPHLAYGLVTAGAFEVVADHRLDS